VIRALLALGRDSFREARDRAVSRILLVLSVVLALGVGTFGFHEVEPRAFFERVLANERAPGGASYDVRAASAAAAGGRARELRATLALRGGGEVAASDDEHLLRPVRRALEGRRLGVERLEARAGREGAPEIEIACRAEDWLDVPGLARASIAGVTEFSLDFAPAMNDPALDFMGPLSARCFLAFWVENTIAGLLAGWAGIIIALIASAAFVPSMLQPGTSHLLLAKPVSRPVMLIAKYVGGIGFVLFHAIALTGLIALAIFVRTGWFDARFLFVGALLTGLFAVVYAVSCVVGVIFESPVTSILLALGFWFGCWAVAATKYNLDHLDEMPGKKLNVPPAVTRAVDAVYWVLPKTSDIGQLAERITNEGRETPQLAAFMGRMRPKIDFPRSIAASAAFTVVVLGLGCYVFSRRDY
jgi:hypothetical protein